MFFTQPYEVEMSDDDSSEETITDLHQCKGSTTETSRDQTLLRKTPESTTLDNMEGTSESTTLDNMEGTSESTTLDNMEGTSESTTLDNMKGTPESTTLDNVHMSNTQPRHAVKVRSKWTGDEVKAVERHLLNFITSCRIPGKRTVTPASKQSQ
ncbi:variant surface antigen D-like isoform X4 [Coregonus clupeaformis]|uniref:variant surface antigen D-like isoform X4 n=1 Tax=Coregonus clupeaformis TaxID=59861 RepID=UPI001E1C875A|nr:variant surface antigen D-like isoform X4 [Coregonus clupeaformis]